MRTVTSPRRRAIAAYDTYEEAQAAVDRLSDHGFPVERVAIVGHGIRYVEQVTGRMTVGRAALLGALQGALLGLLLGLFFGLIFTIDPNPALALLSIYGMVAGAIIGALLGAALHAATGGTRDFVSVPGIAAERYEVVADEEVADRAATILDPSAAE